MKKRIFHILTTIEKGGAENFVVPLINSASSQHDISCFYLKGNGYYRNSLHANGCKVIKLEYSFLNKILTFRKYINKYKPDIIVCHLQPAEFVTFFSTLFNNVKLISVRHNNKKYINNFFTLFIDNLLLFKCSKIITISNYIKKNLASRLFYKKKIYRIYYGTSFKKKNKYSFNKKSLILGNISRFVQFKRIDLLISAINILKKKKIFIKLLILGKGKKKPHYAQMVKTYKLQKNIKFLGFKNNTYKFFNTIDAYITSSEAEGLGLAVIEAMSFAKPVLSNRLGAHRELNKNFRTGLIFKNYPDDIARKILIFIQHSAYQKKKYGINSINTVKKKYNLKLQIRKFNKIMYKNEEKN